MFGLAVSGVKLSLPDGSGAAALTLDACGGSNGSAADRELLNTLRDLGVPATLFINQRWAKANHTMMEEIVSEPLFEVENHGTHHLPLSVNGASAYGVQGTSSAAGVYDEIMENQEFLRTEYGVTCRYFRSGTAHLDETSAQICNDLGLTPVNFTINLDDGATLPAQTVASHAATLSTTDILLGHFNQPASGTGTGLAQALPQLLAEDTRFITLEEAH
ncbi:polysaccharide deacetylase [Nesterenkonia sp. Hz 6-5]|nr:polysaccharide deacetylase [Nesterenkonia haasae]